MNNNEQINIGLPGILGVVFIALKLTGNISWSWWWVLSPFWITFIVGFIIILVIVVGKGVR